MIVSLILKSYLLYAKGLAEDSLGFFVGGVSPPGLTAVLGTC